MKRIAFGAALAASALGLVWIIGACSDNKTGNDGGGTDSGFVTCRGVDLVPGTYPDPTCDPKADDNACTAGAGKCSIDPKCGSQDTCLPLGSNAGKTVLDFRMRKLNVVAPPLLKGLQTIVIDKGILLNTCGENADATFSWLLRVDKTNNTLLTGGAPPVGTPVDPFQPYCFYRGMVNGLNIQPVMSKITFNGGTFSTADGALGQLNIPIFILGNPVPVILPVRAPKINAATIGPDDCIGKFQKDALDNTCIEVDPAQCARWRPNGSLGGYITLADADKVDVRETNKTLCSQLTGDVSGPKIDIGGGIMIQHCGPNAFSQGDYCEATKMAGGCKDSFWLAATFAASATKIDDPGSNPMCQGGASDAGMDATGD